MTVVLCGLGPGAAWAATPPPPPPASAPAWAPYLGMAQVGCTQGNPPSTRCINYHPWPAIDLHMAPGVPARASGDGEVVAIAFPRNVSAEVDRPGLYVVVQHAGSPLSVYKHLAETVVAVGDTVERGQVIGLVGRTASPTYHLHYDEQLSLDDFNEDGNRYPIGSMWARRGGVMVKYPAAVGYGVWSSVPYGTEIPNEGYAEPAVVVANEAQLRAALDTFSASTADGPFTIQVTGPVALTGPAPTYSGDELLMIEGTAPGAGLIAAPGQRALEVTSLAPIELRRLDLSSAGGAPVVGDGGLVHSAGTVTLVELELSGGAASGNGGSVAAGGPVALVRVNGGIVWSARSTVVESALHDGGALGSGGALASVGNVVLSNTTVTGNTAGISGGAIDAGAVDQRHATVVDNVAPLGAAIRSGHLTSQTSVLANGTASCALGGATSRGENRETGTSCGLAMGTDEVIEDPRLGALRFNGGLTPSRMPLAGSPLLDVYGPLPVDQVGVRHPLVCDPSSEVDQRGSWTLEQGDPFPGALLHTQTYISRPAGAGCEIGAVEQTFPRHRFTDVPAGSDAAVRWVAWDPDFSGPAAPLMTGFSGGTFRPGTALNRGQAVRLLYRFAGSPDVSGLPGHGLRDVPPWLEDAVRWALADPDGDGPGVPLMTGFPDDTFRPSLALNRGQALRLLYRFAGSPDVSSRPPHGKSDVPPWLEDAARWAVTDPDGDGPLGRLFPLNNSQLSPSTTFTRGAMASFLYRLALMPEGWADPGAAPAAALFQPG